MVVACKEGRFNCLTVTQMKWSTKKSHQSHQFNATSRFLPSHTCSSCCLVGGLGRRCDIAISRLVLSGHLCWLRRNRYASIQHVIHVIFCEVLIHSIGVHHPSPCQPKPAASEAWQRKAYLGALDFHMSSYMSHPNLPHYRKTDAELNLGTTMPYGKLVISCLLQFFEWFWYNFHVWALYLWHVNIRISYIHDLAMQGCRGTASSVYQWWQNDVLRWWI